MKTQHKLQSRNTGFSLIEILIALVISSLMLVAAMGLLVNNKRIYKEQNAMGRLQENARFALDILIQDIRKAGYIGCADDSEKVTNTLTNSGTLTNLYNFTNTTTPLVNAIEGSENANNWVPSASTEAIASVSALDISSDGVGTMAARPDSITIRYLSPLDNEISISSDMANGATGTNIPVTCTPTADCTSNGPITVLENLAISDCSSTDIFDVTTVAASALSHANGAFTKGYTTASQLSRYVTNRYYIGNGNNDYLGNPIPTLFRYTFVAGTGLTNQPLIEGVENMQILYGEDTTNSDTIADTYVNAAGVTDWDNVVSVRLSILVRTIEQDFTGDVNNNTYSLLGTGVYTTAPGDYRRRRIFSTTVQIRNRSS